MREGGSKKILEEGEEKDWWETEQYMYSRASSRAPSNLLLLEERNSE